MMNDLLVLGHDAARSQELASLFQNAGYEVVEVNDLISCCRRLQSDSGQQQYIPPAMANATGPRGVTIFNPALLPPARGAELLSCILELARQLQSGWRLSLRHRRLASPEHGAVPLTTLEFGFIKMFTMVETGEAVSRKQIVQAFGEDYLTYDQNRIDTMVRRLRHKVETRLGVQLPLNTERVRGFSFGDVLRIDL